MIVVDHAPATAFATEAHTLFPNPPIKVPMPKQFGSATSSGRRLETQPTVSDNTVLTIIVADY